MSLTPCSAKTTFGLGNRQFLGVDWDGCVGGDVVRVITQQKMGLLLLIRLILRSGYS